jgi:hypothetical protein
LLIGMVWYEGIFLGVDFFIVWSSNFIWFRVVFMWFFRWLHEMMCSIWRVRSLV